MSEHAELRGRVREGWSIIDDDHGPAISDDRTGITTRLLRRGRYQIGMSCDEYEAARRLDPIPNLTLSELTPVSDAPITNDILIADRPITVRQATALGVADAGGTASFPAMLTRQEAESVAASLGGRLPREREWEAACRAGTRSLFYWGDDLPAVERLDALLSWDLENDLVVNPLGMGGLFFGEWCDDPFTVSHAPGAEVVPGAFVVRGGGAQFWPWQEQEWVWCASAVRMPSSALFEDGRCAARVVFDVP